MSRQEQTTSLYSQPMELSEPKPIAREDEVIRRAVVRLNGHILGFVLAMIGALIIFLATNWLVLKGGGEVGPHLSLLGQFFIGYSVSFAGSLIGAVYAFVTGYIVGVIVAWIYNKVVFMRSSLRQR